MKKLLSLLCLLVLTVPALPALAQDRYVSDVLYVPLRSGMGNQYRIVHRGLSSGTRLELVREAESEDGEIWSLVRTQDGEEGWIRSQFLLSEPTAALKLERLQQRAGNVSEENQSLEDQLTEARERVSQLEGELQDVRERYAALQDEHERLQSVSSDAVSLHQQHKELSENYQMLQTRYDVVQADNERLKRDRRYQDWLFGGGILVAGVLLSLILQAIGKRRRQSEWR
ncbi:TIGR04211 family SH3 domain-containing protein [Marinimicrobium agarilyticum]|uniref:TIGR04211 family SH3 domain-containing protein n=1 Tax=Marinimicrobium agarilyticum TaxID=306546 RepID=UPI00146A39BC|nr:TIGR04211 family SH3 domain-containing protein [Marinimicrobium agarilyticum]